MLQKAHKPQLTHQRAYEVFAFLADFADHYPQLCERDQAMYRDLCRAAMLSIDNEERAESMLIKRGVDEYLVKLCGMDIGEWIVRRLREQGLTVELRNDPLRLHVGPKEKVTPAILARVSSWKEAIKSALLADVPRK